MSESARIRLERDGHVARLVIDHRARRNAMRHSMWQELGRSLTTIEEDPDVRVVILTGAGDRAFCAGNDISEFSTWRDDPARHQEYDDTSGRAMTLLRSLSVPVIARIRGVCVGGGMELALACDLRFAAGNARFAITPARLGIGYKFEDVDLVVQTVGAAVARRLLFTGRMHSASEALSMGLVDEAHADGDLDAAVSALAATIAGNAPLTLRAEKAAIGEACKPVPDRDGARVQSLVDACHASDDYREGQRAFAEKRPPQFRGR
jgi:enoyl-CoA hydratase/carnithine racemase